MTDEELNMFKLIYNQMGGLPETAISALLKYADKATRECERLQAQCEKLAEALDSCLWADSERGEVTKIAREALAEYRKHPIK